VPLIIKPSGSSSSTGARDQIVESVDIYPTLCDLAGLPLPEGLSGNSFFNHFDQADSSGKPHAFSQFLRYGIWHAPDGEETMGYTIRTKDWRYVEWFHSHSDQCIAKELYDIASQGLEQKNLAGQPEYAAKEEEFAAKLTAYRGQTLPLHPSNTR
jgi:iduronate 2-sulfatase